MAGRDGKGGAFPPVRQVLLQAELPSGNQVRFRPEARPAVRTCWAWGLMLNQDLGEEAWRGLQDVSSFSGRPCTAGPLGQLCSKPPTGSRATQTSVRSWGGLSLPGGGAALRGLPGTGWQIGQDPSPPQGFGSPNCQRATNVLFLPSSLSWASHTDA